MRKNSRYFMSGFLKNGLKKDALKLPALSASQAKERLAMSLNARMSAYILREFRVKNTDSETHGTFRLFRIKK